MFCWDEIFVFCSGHGDMCFDGMRYFVLCSGHGDMCFDGMRSLFSVQAMVTCALMG